MKMALNLKVLASIFALLPLITQATKDDYKTAEKSEEKTLFYDDENYGSIKFTYYTYQSGELGIPLSYMYGKIEIEDKNYPTVECNPDLIDWSQDPPVCPTTKVWKPSLWNETSQVRIAMEFGEIENKAYDA